MAGTGGVLARPAIIAILSFVLVGPLVVPDAAADHEYVQPVWFKWDTMRLDVLILGVDDPRVGAAISDGIDRWRQGIPQFAPQWLTDGLEIRTYWPAVDETAPEDFEANILFAPQGFYAFYSPFLDSLVGKRHCVANAPMMAGWGSPVHVVAHEFGHCLGLGHVFNHDEEYSPAFDIMGGGQRGHVSCPSNFNVLVLERVFGHLVGKPSGGEVVMSASDYLQSHCT